MMIRLLFLFMTIIIACASIIGKCRSADGDVRLPARHDVPFLPEFKAACVSLAIDSCPQVGNLCARSGGARVGLPRPQPPI
jgi:hypothetical protein